MEENDQIADKEEVLKIAEGVGSVSHKMLEYARERVKPGAKLLDVANAIEAFAKEQGYGLAFPVNLSINEYAAHYAPSSEDERVFGESDVVKIDLGAEKNGVLGDCAITVDLSGENGKLIEASEEALQNAISTVRAGVKLGDIGKVIEETIKGKGYVPIKNLGGHGVRVNDLHSDPFIPNYGNGDDTVLNEGDIIALEPFATSGKGYVVNSDFYEIYGYVGEAATRNGDARIMLKEIEKSYRDNPFAVRWLSGLFSSSFSLYSAVRELLRVGAIEVYPALVESGKGLVSQFEHEMVVEKDGCRVLTK